MTDECTLAATKGIVLAGWKEPRVRFSGLVSLYIGSSKDCLRSRSSTAGVTLGCGDSLCKRSFLAIPF